MVLKRISSSFLLKTALMEMFRTLLKDGGTERYSIPKLAAEVH